MANATENPTDGIKLADTDDLMRGAHVLTTAEIQGVYNDARELIGAENDRRVEIIVSQLEKFEKVVKESTTKKHDARNLASDMSISLRQLIKYNEEFSNDVIRKVEKELKHMNERIRLFYERKSLDTSIIRTPGGKGTSQTPAKRSGGEEIVPMCEVTEDLKAKSLLCIYCVLAALVASAFNAFILEGVS